MQLCPKEVCVSLFQNTPLRPTRATLTALRQLDKLVISQLGQLAQRRLARGVKLNHSEATVCGIGTVN